MIVCKTSCCEFDYKLTFNAHIDDIYKRAALKLNTLSRIALCMDFNKGF